jgi:hypothetical protein
MKILKDDRIEGGWFIGNFPEGVLQTEDFEVAVKVHPEGEEWDIHYHKIATEYNYLIEGNMIICGKNLCTGDIFVIKPLEIANPTFLSDCKIVTVKVPGAKDDKYTISRSTKLIAHRGNFAGKDEIMENCPDYLKRATEIVDFVEADIWFIGNRFYTGHDEPQYLIDGLDLLREPKMVWHAKSIETMRELMRRNMHCFMHDKDEAALTSKGWLWKYPEVYYRGELFGYCSDSVI